MWLTCRDGTSGQVQTEWRELFGNGRAYRNVDIVISCNEYVFSGVDPGLDFSDMPASVRFMKKCTGMKVDERSLQRSACVYRFRSHQDAIAGGNALRERKKIRSLDSSFIFLLIL